jgi:hypothetical protein
MAASYIFNDILLDGIRSGQVPARTKKARTWYRDKAKGTKATQTALLSDSERLRSRPLPGTMVFFVYDPKTKKQLPYYDRFPLTIIVDVTSDGWTGLNLHYLPLAQRAKLMDALYTISSNKKYDEKTRLNLTYQTLKGAAKFRAFKPCYKRYLGGFAKSKFLYVNPSEWDIALFLPVENFKKASKGTVWKDSMKSL